jgi:hypothetical protein
MEVKVHFCENLGAAQTQLSRFVFYDCNGVAVSPIDVTNPNGNNPKNETALKVIESEGKWLDRNKTSTLVFGFDRCFQIGSYELFTANDFPPRDPCAWSMYVKQNGGEWKKCTYQRCTPPTARNSSYGRFECDGKPNTVVTMQITKNNGARMTQLSHVAFYDPRGNRVIPISVENEPEGDHPLEETPDQLIEKQGKWLDRHSQSTLVFTFSPDSTIASYEMFTANDEPERDPTSWTMHISKGNSGRTEIVHTKSVTPPTERLASYGTFTMRRVLESHTLKLHSLRKKCAPATYKLKFSITENVGARVTQLSAIRFYDEHNNLVRPISVTNPDGNNPRGESAEKLLCDEGKWLDRHTDCTLVFEFDVATPVASYQMVTGNDVPQRDPVKWTVSKGVNDTWTEIDSRTVSPPRQRLLAYDRMNFGDCTFDSKKAQKKPEVQEKTEAELVFPPSARSIKVSSSNDGKYSCDNLMGPESYWNSGRFAPQWVRIDLGRKSNVSYVTMKVDQHPAGFTKHEIYCKESPDSEEVKVATIAGDSHKGEVIEVFFPSVRAQFVRIHTVESPSWVAWRDVKIGQKDAPNQSSFAILRFD